MANSTCFQVAFFAASACPRAENPSASKITTQAETRTVHAATARIETFGFPLPPLTIPTLAHPRRFTTSPPRSNLKVYDNSATARNFPAPPLPNPPELLLLAPLSTPPRSAVIMRGDE